MQSIEARLPGDQVGPLRAGASKWKITSLVGKSREAAWQEIVSQKSTFTLLIVSALQYRHAIENKGAKKPLGASIVNT